MTELGLDTSFCLTFKQSFALVMLIYGFALGSQKFSFTFSQSMKGNTGAGRGSTGGVEGKWREGRKRTTLNKSLCEVDSITRLAKQAKIE